MASFAFFRQVGSAGSVTDVVVNVDQVTSVRPGPWTDCCTIILGGEDAALMVKGDLIQVVEILRAADAGGATSQTLRQMNQSLARMAEETSY